MSLQQINDDDDDNNNNIKEEGEREGDKGESGEGEEEAAEDSTQPVTQR
jgi:hypothetical protein